MILGLVELPVGEILPEVVLDQDCCRGQLDQQSGARQIVGPVSLAQVLYLPVEDHVWTLPVRRHRLCLEGRKLLVLVLPGRPFQRFKLICILAFFALS